jgi:diadenosine tetraphosphate (Ap4A) HIT family hydrolase
LASNEGFVAFPDAYPVNEGHTLIASRRHVQDMFDLNGSEFGLLYQILHRVKMAIDERLHPQGYNVGANCGPAAGQTIPHFHLHVIPRYTGDIENPRGGVRNIKTAIRPY